MDRWHARGLVAGPALPTDAIRLSDRCRVYPVMEEASLYMREQAQQRASDLDVVSGFFGDPDVFSAEMPVTALVRSRHELSIVVEARNAALAEVKATEDASRHLSALALAVGVQRYRFYPSVMNRLPGGGSVDFANQITTRLGSATVYEERALPPAAVDDAEALLVLADEDGVLGRAFEFLHAAWLLKDVPVAEPTINRAVLSNCFLALEAVSEAMTKEWRKRNKPSILTEQGRIIDALEGTLGRATKASKKVAAVRDASRALQRAELHFQDLKLEAAGRALGVEQGLVELARELNGVRNRALSHAGSEEPDALAEWVFISDDPRQATNQAGHFGKAEQTAMAYVDAYAKFMRKP